MADKNTHSAKQPENYKKIKTLGQCAQGTAYLEQAESERSFAVIKKIDLTKMTEEERKTAYREVKILELFNHAGIIKFREVYKNK
jgi:serine/threonine protein kinase